MTTVKVVHSSNKVMTVTEMIKLSDKINKKEKIY